MTSLEYVKTVVEALSAWAAVLNKPVVFIQKDDLHQSSHFAKFETLDTAVSNQKVKVCFYEENGMINVLDVEIQYLKG